MVNKIKSFLFENQTSKQTVIKNSFWLLMSEFFSRIFTFLISLRVARSLGVEEFGAYNFVMTFCVFFVLIADFGLSNLTFRELSKDQSQFQKYFINTILIKIILSIVVLIIVAVIAKHISGLQIYFSLIMIFLLHALLTNIAEFIRVFFRHGEKMQHEAYLKISNGIILLITTIICLKFSPTIKSIFYGFLISSSINLIYSLFYSIRHFKLSIDSRAIDPKFMKKIILMSIPFFLGGIFVYFYSDINLVLLKYFKNTYEVGLFSAPYRLMAYLYILFNVFSIAIFKKLVDATKDIFRFKSILRKFAMYHFFISFSCAFIILIGGEWILHILYGNQFISAQNIFNILSLIIIIKSLSYVYGGGLTALSKEYTRLYIQIGIAIINIVSNLILIPKFGALGAAYSLLIAEICLMLTYRGYVYVYIKKFSKN